MVKNNYATQAITNNFFFLSLLMWAREVVTGSPTSTTCCTFTAELEAVGIIHQLFLWEIVSCVKKLGEGAGALLPLSCAPIYSSCIWAFFNPLWKDKTAENTCNYSIWLLRALMQEYNQDYKLMFIMLFWSQLIRVCVLTDFGFFFFSSYLYAALILANQITKAQ